MRLTVLFFLIGIGIGVSQLAYSQSELSVKMTDKTVREVFRTIEQNSKYIFFYYDDAIDINRKVSINMENESIENILNKLFESTDNAYMIEDRQIFISRKKTIGRSQDPTHNMRIIYGTINDTDGKPLIGVNIKIKGTHTGTITDDDGMFKLSVAQNNTTLTVSYIGYKTEEITLADQPYINITLTPDELGLDEVLVIGYGFAKKKDLTGSISSIKGEKLKETASFSTIESLQGRAAGVTVMMESARPGEEAYIRIRGNRSLKAMNEPLYVIDGIPVVMGISDLSSSNIESIEILKDASATAIYGSRGANGVVLITTKKGKTGKTQIEYNGYFGIQKANHTIPMMNGAEWVELIRESNRATTKTTPYPLIPSLEWDRKIGNFTADPNVWNKIENSYDTNGNWHPERVAYTDWTLAALKASPITNHEISVLGGTNNIRILTSATYFNQEGIVRGQNYSRYTIRFNFDWELTPSVKIGTKTQFSHYDLNYGTNLYSEVKNTYPLADIRDENGEYIIERPGGDPQLWNKFLNLDYAKRDNKKDRFLGSYYMEIKLPFNILYRTNVGVDVGHWQIGEFYGPLSSDRAGGLSRALNRKRNQQMYLWENVLSTKTYINNNQTLDITLLQSIQQETSSANEIDARDLPYESQLWHNVGTAQSIGAVGSEFIRWRLASFMGRVNYSLNDKYIATMSVRYDGSSRLASGHKWVMFPSAAIAWKLNEESLIKNMDIFSNLKLRLGYGITGNTAIDPYTTQGNLDFERYNYGTNGVLAFYQQSMPNQNLSWEKTSQWNMGLDFGLTNGRVKGNIDIYRQTTKDLLMERQLPITSGFSGVVANIGQIRNQGIELTLNTTNIDHPNFKWYTDIISSINKEEIRELYNGKADDEGNRWFIGKPVNVFYNYKANGIWQLEDTEELAKWKGLFKPGDIKIVDKNGDYKITSDDRFVYSFAFSRFFLQPVQKRKSLIPCGNQGFTLICFFLWLLL